MSDKHEEDHTGPIKTPTQLLVTVAISFIAPVFIIIGLVYYVSTQTSLQRVPTTRPKRWPLGCKRWAALRFAMPTVSSNPVKRSTKPNARPAMRWERLVHPNLQMLALGVRASKQATKVCSTRPSKARVRWVRKAVAISKIWKSGVPWFIWQTLLAPNLPSRKSPNRPNNSLVRSLKKAPLGPFFLGPLCKTHLQCS